MLHRDPPVGRELGGSQVVLQGALPGVLGRLLHAEGVLDDLSAEIDLANESPFEDPVAMRHIHDLELMLRYGEDKLENLLS